MRKIFLSAGHSVNPKRDRGAAGNGYIEGEQALEFRNILYDELKKLGVTATVDKPDSILADSITFFKNITSSDSIVLDIHFNAATPKATGTETLVPSNPSAFEKLLASKLSTTVSEILGIPTRGVNGVKTEAESHHGRLGWMRLTGENVLMEICFISNKQDILSFRDKRFDLGKAVARVLFDFANDTIPQQYTVVSGDNLSKIALKFKTTVDKIKKDNALKTDVLQINQKLKV